MRKEKLKKFGLCFMKDCFMKPFQMVINCFFLFPKVIRSAIFAFLCQGYQKGKLATACN